MSIKLSGEWKLKVKSKSAAFKQRIFIAGTSNNQDGTFSHSTFGTKTLQGSFGIQIQYQKPGDAWKNSLMRIGNVSRTATKLVFEIQSDDNVGYGDYDFNDLVLEAERTIANHEWCIWGQAKLYSGCIFNPCILPRFVIDDFPAVIDRFSPKVIAKLKEILPVIPEIPPVKGPFPPPPPPWDYRAMQVEIPREHINSIFKRDLNTIGRGAFRTPGLRTLLNPSEEVHTTAGLDNLSARLVTPDFRRYLKCHIEPARNLLLRVAEYDPAPGDTEGDLFPTDGNRDPKGYVITDDWGFYLFCFNWAPQATGHGKPDMLLQFIKTNEEGIPSVALESPVSWNIPKLIRKDFCIPKHLIDETTGQEVPEPGRIFQYIGNLPVTRIKTGFTLERGHATSVPGDMITVDRAPFGGVLYLKGNFNDALNVQSYRIKYYTTDCPEGNTPLTLLSTPLTYYNVAFDPVKVGPGPAIFAGTPGDAYPNMENHINYTHPFGNHYKGYINTAFIKTGYLHLVIEGLNAAGAPISGADDTLTVRIDNKPPVPSIEPIMAGSESGAACGLITIHNPGDKFPFTYRVIDSEGHLYRYYFRIFKCHNNSVNGLHYNTVYGASNPLFWHGTPDEASLSPDMEGWVTRDMPETGSWFTAQEIADGVNFGAFSIELWAVSRTTDGRHAHLHWPRYVEVIGVNFDPTP